MQNSACNGHHEGVFRKKRKKKVHLARGEELSMVFLMVLEVQRVVGGGNDG